MPTPLRNIRVDDETWQRWQEAAQKAGIDVSELMRRAVGHVVRAENSAAYLLKAEDEDMARWKEQAEARGVSFAEYIRLRLDGLDAPPPYRSGKRSYEPDPRVKPKPKASR